MSSSNPRGVHQYHPTSLLLSARPNAHPVVFGRSIHAALDLIRQLPTCLSISLVPFFPGPVMLRNQLVSDRLSSPVNYYGVRSSLSPLQSPLNLKHIPPAHLLTLRSMPAMFSANQLSVTQPSFPPPSCLSTSCRCVRTAALVASTLVSAPRLCDSQCASPAPYSISRPSHVRYHHPLGQAPN